MVGLPFISVVGLESGAGKMAPGRVNDGVNMAWQPVVADLMADREPLEAVTIYVGRIADAELSVDRRADSTPIGALTR